MRMSAADQARFPRSTRYIRQDLPQVINVPVIARAVATTGQLALGDFAAALHWGNFPTLVASSLSAGTCARFSPTPGNNVIEIGVQLFRDFEAGRGWLTTGSGARVAALGVNILHEMVHWGDNRDGVDRPGEEGDEFEQLVYRANLGC